MELCEAGIALLVSTKFARPSDWLGYKVRPNVGTALDAATILSNLQRSVAAQQAPLIFESAIRQTACPSKGQ
jgi:hypothetical protein